MKRTLYAAILVSVLVAGCAAGTAGASLRAGSAAAPVSSGTVLAGLNLPSPSVVPTPVLLGQGGTGVDLGSPAATAASLEFVGLRYRLVDELGRALFCDPDLHPVGWADESTLAHHRLPEIRADTATYQLILGHLELGPAATLTDDQVVALYREWKMLRAIVLQPTGGAYHFDYVAALAGGPERGWHVTGTLDTAGTISLMRREPSGPTPCPK